MLGVLLCTNSKAQTFDTFSLYFEDAKGSLDTLRLDRIEEGATRFIDEELGEIDLKDQPLNGFDVRFYRFEAANVNSAYDIIWFCTHEDGDVDVNDNNSQIYKYLHETKQLIWPKFNCSPSNFGIPEKFFIPNSAAFPVTVTWDSSLLQDTCHYLSRLTEVPPVRFSQFVEFGIEFCPDRINHPLISLRDSNSVVLTKPNFLTMMRADGSLVSTYYIDIRNNFIPPVSVDNTLESEITLSPNPNDGLFQIGNAPTDASVEIYSITGQLVKSYDSTNQEIRIEEKGVFIVSIRTEEGIVTKKVVCQ